MMGTKNNPAKFDCYANALPDEPYFVLLARDESAPDMIEHWAFNRLTAIAMGQKPESDQAMVEEAVALAHQMRQWRTEHDGEWRMRESDDAEFGMKP